MLNLPNPCLPYTCYTTQILDLLPDKSCHVRPQREANQMCVVVDVPDVVVDGVDEDRDLLPDQPGVDGSPHVVGVHSSGRPVDTDDVGVLL